jgi:hypothetical protein
MYNRFMNAHIRATLLENTGFNSLYTYGLYLVQQTHFDGYDPLGMEDDISDCSESYRKLKSLYETVVRENFDLLRLNVNDYIWTNHYQHVELHQSGFENAAGEYVMSRVEAEDEECDEGFFEEEFRDDYSSANEFHEFMQQHLFNEANAEVMLDVLRLIDGDYSLVHKDLLNHDLHELMIETLYDSVFRDVQNIDSLVAEHLWDHQCGGLVKHMVTECDDDKRRAIVEEFLLRIESKTPEIEIVVETSLPLLFDNTPNTFGPVASRFREVEVEA